LINHFTLIVEGDYVALKGSCAPTRIWQRSWEMGGMERFWSRVKLALGIRVVLFVLFP
jgi:hypothetical protein